MAYDERQSPRAAIHSWLQQTPRPETNSTESVPEGRNAESRRHQTRRQQKITGQTKPRGHPKRIANGECGERLQLDPRIDQSIPDKSRGEEPQGQTRKPSQPKPGHPGFADSLGLHAPFRIFGDPQEEVREKPKHSVHKRTRKRNASSTTSYLEPAVVDRLIEVECDDRSVHLEGRLRTPSRSGGDGNVGLSSRPLQKFQEAITSPGKPVEAFERRPRHKTRADRYELKESTRQRKKPDKNNEEDKKRKKHKRKEKSGAALMHDFTAHNISHSRITLQPATALGLFGKGRASSPVRRRGLPDLTFSETAFLSHGRLRHEDTTNRSNSKPSDKRKKQKITKAADTEEEISRYFTSARNLNQTISRPQSGEQSRWQQTRRLQDPNSPPDFIDLPDKPFLGFGSSGAVSMSPVRRLNHRVSKGEEQGLTRSPTRSTTYFTWSQSTVRSAAPTHRLGNHIMPLASSHLCNRGSSFFASSKAEIPQPPISSPFVHRLSRRYQDAAAGTTPPSKHSKNTSCAKTGSPLCKDGRRNSSPSRREHPRPEKTWGEADNRPSEKAPIATAEVAENENRRQEVSSHQSIPGETILSSRKVGPWHEAGEGTARILPIDPGGRSLSSPSLDPLDMILERLLQEGKQHRTIRSILSATGSQRQYKSDPDQRRSISSGIGTALDKPFPGLNLRPSIDRPGCHSVQLQQVASELDSIKRCSQHDHELVVESQDRQGPNYVVSARSGPSLAEQTLQHARGSLPTRHDIKTKPRGEWNGYDAIYERQRIKDDSIPIGGPIAETGRLPMNSEIDRQVDAFDIHQRYYCHGPGTPLVAMHDQFRDEVPNRYEGEDFSHNSYELARHGPMLEDELIDQSNHHHACIDIECPSLAGLDRHSVSRNSVYGDHEQNRRHDDGFLQQKGFGEIDYAQSEAISPQNFHSIWRSSFSSANPSVVEDCSVAQNEVDDPALSNFWTPHRLY